MKSSILGPGAFAALVLTLSLGACAPDELAGPPVPPPDVVPGDSDAAVGEPDAGVTDPGEPDAGVADPGEPDTGVTDPGEPDAGATAPVDGRLGARPVKPNVMLLIDRSGSMAEPSACGSTSCPSKWDQLLTLGGYLAEAKTGARLGLTFFPQRSLAAGDSCAVSSGIVIPISDAPDIDEQILSAAMSTRPGGSTPVADAIDVLIESGELADPDRKNILLVLTDGHPNCACGAGDILCERAEAVAAVERMRSQPVRVDVDIIGFGTSAVNADETLSAMATAAGDDRYYQADTIEDLIGTLFRVSVANIPCRFDLDTWPDPDRLIVWMDGVEVAACDAEPCASGYTYDQAVGRVWLHGESCASIRDGERHNVWFEETP